MVFSESAGGDASYVTLSAPVSSQGAAGQSLHSLSSPQWHVSHSTHEQWKSARNVQLRLGPTSESEIKWSWQMLSSPKVKRSKTGGSDVIKGGWEVLGAGKEGNLESWMIETAYGIEDSSG
jgi:hypothetical protein